MAKYMLSKLTDDGTYEGQPTLGTFNKAFDHFHTDAEARRYFAHILEMRQFEAGKYGIYRSPSSSTDGLQIHTMQKIRATMEQARR